MTMSSLPRHHGSQAPSDIQPDPPTQLSNIHPTIGTGMAILIVRLSHHKDIDSWSGRKAPQVLLSYTTTVANSLMGVAFAEAAVITFWRGAVGGMPVSNLHYVWASSSSVVGALTSLWRRRAVGVSLVSILVAISTLLRGPLMQRATYVELVDLEEWDTIKIPVMANMSDEWGGMLSGHALTDLRFSPGFADAVARYQAQSPMSLLGADCKNCSVNVVAFGFQVNCTATNVPYNLTGSVEAIMNGTLGATVFDSKISVVNESPKGSLLNISVVRKVDVGYEGNLEHKVCLLAPSLLNYSMFLDDNLLSFQSENWFDAEAVEDPVNLPPADSFVAPINMTVPYITGFGSTIPALHAMGSLLFDSTSNVSHGGAVGWTTSNSGLLSNLYYTATTPAARRSSDPKDYSFDDPMVDIINAYRDIAFRMSLQAATEENEGLSDKDAKVFQEVESISHQSMARYAMDKAALAVAVVISLIGPVATLMLFWGWWKLGRRFTMSPLEMINAVLAPGEEEFFDDYDMNGNDEREGQSGDRNQREVARLLAECNKKGDASGADLANHVRQNKKEEEPVLKYGVDGRGKLSMKVVGGGGVRRRRQKEGGFVSGLVDVLLNDG
ncbi:hypothetical protein NEUTE1DRAFT_97331 [Neurospora tetrasperma FGSC 2508]|uniref:Uncharacterized protein n=1 Tax=Neurospora tetrasperma (strain FGSC 2508 / ATCC MYA-4615 / P0657) TaxID=510951 RepID=F8MAJ9_NEUT8|nr:uncharacterized protein NEUTE1DRAFT_97331 [Neurospora tetrasperma FGSC 2508]EGO60120.1 hypothetical protein NEUTE1DRAFT_97331 [Neurospora tetrasperma FGSC 2508]EGZ75930.1 hypothetical protein NEUTE2DRAFT_58103 [Neurospora tetrasperma FGSC 2509]